MGPTPEPLANGGLSDEEMPQQPPIFLSSSDDEDEEPINSDYPEGYMPIPHHVEIQWASDTEESDSEDVPVSVPVLLPTSFSLVELERTELAAAAAGEAPDEEAIDYNSLAGLMSALAANGPNQGEELCGLQTAYLHDPDTEDTTASGPPLTRRRPVARIPATNGPAVGTSAATPSSAVAATATITTALTDPARQDPDEDRLPLAPDQEAAVLRAMQGFTLPASAIPAWASDLPDTAFTSLVRDKMVHSSHTQNN